MNIVANNKATIDPKPNKIKNELKHAEQWPRRVSGKGAGGGGGETDHLPAKPRPNPGETAANDAKHTNKKDTNKKAANGDSKGPLRQRGGEEGGETPPPSQKTHINTAKAPPKPSHMR